MREFVYGTAEQFQALDQALAEGMNYKYADRHLPSICSPNTACLWFGKVNDSYHMCIDKGITTNSGSEEFKRFLERGEATFASINGLADFLHSLQPLFAEESPTLIEENALAHNAPVVEKETEIEVMANDYTDTDGGNVIDRKKLNAICEEDSKPRTIWPEEIATLLKKRVFGQDAVIDALSDMVVINKIRKEDKLLAVTFLGPTATGKSETAKSLSEIMTDVYGEAYGNIEIAGNELIGEHSVHRFFGAPPGYVGHGEPTLLEPVRKNPYHVIVINEIEKADEKILIGLMEAIDTGLLGMADNTKPINLNKCILIFTSNIPIDMEKYESSTRFEQSEMCRDAFTRHCGRPEISGKIGNFLVFRALSDEAMTDIVIKFIREELESYDLVLSHIDEYLMVDFLKQRTKYGARGIRSLVGEAVGRHLLRNRQVTGLKGRKIALVGSIDNIEFEEEDV